MIHNVLLFSSIIFDTSWTDASVRNIASIAVPIVTSKTNWPERHRNTLWTIWSNTTFNSKKPLKSVGWKQQTIMYFDDKYAFYGKNPSICIFAFNLLPVAQDGWGISWIHVEISFCRPKKNSKILKLNAKRNGFYQVRWMQLCRQFSWLLPCI